MPRFGAIGQDLFGGGLQTPTRAVAHDGIADLAGHREPGPEIRSGGLREQALLSGQALAAFGTPRRQHTPAARGRHTATETVAALANKPARLIGAFHATSP